MGALNQKDRSYAPPVATSWLCHCHYCDKVNHMNRIHIWQKPIKWPCLCT